MRDARPAADVALRVADSSDPATVRRDLTYTATITNGGPAAATGVTLVVELPADASFTSTTGATCTAGKGKPAACSLAISERSHPAHPGCDWRRQSVARLRA